MARGWYFEASGGDVVMFKRRIKRLIDALVDLIDTVRWAREQRKLAQKWRLPPEKEDDMQGEGQ